MKLITIFNIKEMTEMMKKCDMFESFKCAVEIAEAEVKKAPTKAQMEKGLKQDDEKLQAVLFAYIEDGKKPLIVFNENYKVYSDGEKWITRDEFIKSLDFND